MECGPEKCPIRVFSDLTPAEQRVERKRTAEKMIKQGFTQAQIAKQLGVSRETITKDLDGLVMDTKPQRPKGGRPLGKKKAKSKPRQTDAVETAIIARAEKGEASTTIAAAVGLDGRAVRHVIERERIRDEVRSDPEITRDALALSAQQKLDAAIRQHQRKLDIMFEQRVQEEARRRVDEIVLPHWKEKIDIAERILARRHGIMSKETFNSVRRALHPDSRNGVSDKKLAEAFDAFMQLEKLLLNEKDSPTETSDIPSSLAEWDRMRVKRTVKKRPVSNVARRH
jgi:transposase